MKTPDVVLDESQALWFRARRSHLAGTGAPDVPTTARALVGAQAQVETCASWGLSLRTQSAPDHARVQAELLKTRSVVRTWGMRDTLHIVPAGELRRLIAAQSLWPQTGRRGGTPPESDLAACLELFHSSGSPLGRSDIMPIISAEFVASLADHPGAAQGGARRFAATRIIWTLAGRGSIVFADRAGSEQRYVDVRAWLAGRGQDDVRTADADAEQAAIGLVDSYLSSFAPATAADVAHFFGARIADARRWLDALDVVAVACGARKDLVACRDDVEALLEPAPEPGEAWPARMLPGYDGHLMTHHDKTWLLPDRRENALVWQKAAVVAPVVLWGGRAVATWSAMRGTRRTLPVVIQPLKQWTPACLPTFERDLARYANWGGYSETSIEIAPPARPA